MADRNLTITLRDRQVTGGSLPVDAIFGEPFVNLFDGVLKFSGVTGGSFEPSQQASVFEVGSKLHNQKVTNRFNVNDLFVISGDTGLISTYNGVSTSGLVGKFLSGTTAGFVLANIADIIAVQTAVQPGSNISTGGTLNNPVISLVASPSVNNLVSSGSAQMNTATAVSFSAATLSGGTIYSGGTNLYSIFQQIGTDVQTAVQPGSNITTGGTLGTPIVSLIASPSVNNLVSSGSVQMNTATAVLLSGATVNGDTMNVRNNIIVGSPSASGNVTIYGSVLVVGAAISGFTSQLFVEDNLIQMNYNPTGSTTSTSLGAGWSIQDGSGVFGTDAFLDIRGTSVGLSGRSFTTNLQDIRIRESGTVNSPNGVRVIAEWDIIDGGVY
jgi:hypothetical protein